MSLELFKKSKGTVYVVLAAFALFLMPPGLAAGGRPGAAETGALTGFVYAKDVRTPVEGAIVKIRNLADMTEMAGLPTDAKGMYTITGVPEGRYALGVTSGGGDFNLDYALYVKAGELGKLSISLAAAGVAEAGSGGQEEGISAPAKKKGFFETVAGRVLVVSAIGVGLYFLVVETESSPIR
ncbi:MAG TPA: carboxypeptidase regulatory-like domain-containing protein [Candidatus Aminicenantes bacterium]|nr:carboxypeptidase regulatory-like domain-containing protein [Candidatus Aminicenantes bacterium]